MAAIQVIEGTWEEVARQADQFAGKHVRLLVLSTELPAPEVPPLGLSTPAERAKAWREWCDTPRRSLPQLSDDAVSRESIYFGEQD